MEWLKGIGASIVLIIGTIPLIRKAFKENKDVYEKSIPIAKKVKLYFADKKLDAIEREDLANDLLDWAIEVDEATEATKKLWDKFKMIKFKKNETKIS